MMSGILVKNKKQHAIKYTDKYGGLRSHMLVILIGNFFFFGRIVYSQIIAYNQFVGKKENKKGKDFNTKPV